jgi:predicted ribosome quality control (RQC) complex YloA/Tae2 family protein
MTKKLQPPPRVFHTARGSTVLVGRCARQNDELTENAMSYENAYWFHVAGGVPGAHVVLLPMDDVLTKKDIEEAAGLALAYSKSPNRRFGKGKVIYCRASHVDKIQGSAPGSVIAMQSKSIMVSSNRR